MLFTAVINGSSLPGRLTHLGVAPRTHRLLIRHGRLPLKGQVWLSLARHLGATRIDSPTQCQAYLDAIRTLADLGVGEISIAIAVMDWCIAKGPKQISPRLNVLIQRFHDFMEMTVNCYIGTPAVDDLLGWLVTVPEALPGETSQRVNPLFVNYPDVPATLRLPPNWELRSLNDWQKVLSHGEAQRNCMGDLFHAFRYLWFDTVLFGLYVDGQAKATIAIVPICGEGGTELQAMEFECKDLSIFQDARWHSETKEIPVSCPHPGDVAQASDSETNRTLALPFQGQHYLEQQFEVFVEDLIGACKSQPYIKQWTARGQGPNW